MSVISRWSRFLFFCVPIFIAIHQLACAAPVPPEKVADGVVFHAGDRLLTFDSGSDDIIRAAYVNDTSFSRGKPRRQAYGRTSAHNCHWRLTMVRRFWQRTSCPG
jgi:hypothetical protein